MIEVREGRAKYDIYNIDDVESIINDLCVNQTSYENKFLPLYCKVKCVNKDVIIIILSSLTLSLLNLCVVVSIMHLVMSALIAILFVSHQSST